MVSPTSDTLHDELTPDGRERAPRAPQQERGQRRVEQILDAAELVFAEEGVDGATMQRIAERAGASVGSLYHFYPNKDAIVEDLGRRYADAIRDTNREAMPLSMAHAPLEELFERVVDFQFHFIARTPAFAAVHDAVQRNCAAINDALNQAISGHVGQFLALRYPTLPEPQRAASAMLSVQVVHSGIELVGKLPEQYQRPVIAELKRMLIAHFAAMDREHAVRPQ